jgi:hypothetical protein
MHIVQIKQPEETWIVAMSQHKEDTTEYLATLSEEIQKVAFLYEIPIEYYPFILIENTQTPHDSNSYFEFCGFEELQQRIDVLRLHQAESEHHIYFKYYYISGPYAQIVTDQNWMQYLRHTPVTNYILEQPYPISLFHEEVKKSADRYDIDRLDQLFEHTQTRFTSDIEKEDLAINGYENLFWEMNYDHACGKLTESGIEYLLPMVEKMELLLDQKKWQHRSYALHIVLETACKNKSETIFELLKEMLEAFENYLISHPEEKPEIHRLVSLAYRWMITAETENALLYWQNAVVEIKKAVNFDPEKVSWLSFLELIYSPFTENEKIHQEQIREQKKFTADILNLENERGSIITYKIALAYQNLQEHLEWKEIKNVFPENLVLNWAEKALAYQPKEISQIDLYECAEFFSKTGLKYRRCDFLEKTISVYEQLLNLDKEQVLEVFYIANIYKEMAHIHIEHSQYFAADEAIRKAKLCYEFHIDKVKSNSSLKLHYTEFLEYCYNYEGSIQKPTLKELKCLANEVEAESGGYLNYPYLLLARIALYENDEQKAILELTKSLILHELSMSQDCQSFLEDVQHSDCTILKSFLADNVAFMNEVSEYYYFDPDIKWQKLSTMSSEEIVAYWKSRKEDIRNRPKLNIL